jgi:hypothetical protein
MNKYHLIYDTKGTLVGYTQYKSLLKKFLHQRDLSRYIVYQAYEDELQNYDIECISDADELVMLGSKAIFLGEEEYFMSGVSQYQLDLKNYMTNLFSMLDVLKIDESEKKVIIKSFKILNSILIRMDEDGEGLLDILEIFDVDKMIEKFTE